MTSPASQAALLAYIQQETGDYDLTYVDLAAALDQHLDERMDREKLRRHSATGKISATYVAVLAKHYGINRPKALASFGFIDKAEVMEMARELEAEQRRLGFSNAPATGRNTFATRDLDTTAATPA